MLCCPALVPTALNTNLSSVTACSVLPHRRRFHSSFHACSLTLQQSKQQDVPETVTAALHARLQKVPALAPIVLANAALSLMFARLSAPLSLPALLPLLFHSTVQAAGRAGDGNCCRHTRGHHPAAVPKGPCTSAHCTG